MDARMTALSALIACRRQGAWSDGILKEYMARDRLDRRDCALAARLTYGVLQNRMLLDFYLAQLVQSGLSKLEPAVLDILRLGAYQILFLEKVPDSAAVNEAVEQTGKLANRRAAGLVNAVLRNLSRRKAELPEPDSLSVRYSHPAELVELLRENVGDALLEPLLRADNEAVPTVFQLNPLMGSPEETVSELEACEIRLEMHPWLSGCLYAFGTGNLEKLDAFREGRIYVQDPAARLAAMAAGVKPGMAVLDACAAPGGKSFAAAMQMENRGSIVSCDLHDHKTALIEKGAARLGINILRAMQADATVFRPEWEGAFDTVIADVPCSGLGVIRKKPDIRYKDVRQLAGLPQVQSAIIENVSRYVRPGGVLLYSTCTVLKRENEQIVQAFLEKHPDFLPESFPVPEGLELPNAGMATLLPCLHGTDGFFIAKLRRAT